jgi:hypothetical protein
LIGFELEEDIEARGKEVAKKFIIGEKQGTYNYIRFLMAKDEKKVK